MNLYLWCFSRIVLFLAWLIVVGASFAPNVIKIIPERPNGQWNYKSGDSIRITCKTTIPVTSLSWVPDGPGLPTFCIRVAPDESELQFKRASTSNSGVYKCVADSDSKSINISVQAPESPKIVIYPQPFQRIMVGKSATIQCKIRRGSPQPKIEWRYYFDKNPQKQNAEEWSALRFRSVTEEDSGEYTCRASNNVGQVDAVATLEVISLPTISIFPAGQVVEVLAGQPVKFECIASGKPTPIVEWQPLVTHLNSSVSSFEEPRPSGLAVLSFNAVQPIDANTYVCVASNVAGRAEERVQLVVSDRGPQLPPTPDSSISLDEAITFPQGTNAYLRCGSGSREEIFTQWSREDNLPLKPTRDESQPGLLVLNNVDLSDSGKYVCTGVSKPTSGRTLFTHSLILRITADAPKVTLYPQRQIVRPGDSASINCSATGSRPISIHWSFLSGTALPSSASFDGGLLQFNSMSVYDAGQYMCTAENNIGQASAIAKILVSEVSGPMIPIIRASDRARTALENSNMDLTCVVDHTTQEPYEIVWSYARGELPLNSQTSGGTLRFYRLKPENSGRYTCRVKSAHGDNEDHIWLQVEQTSRTSGGLPQLEVSIAVMSLAFVAQLLSFVLNCYNLGTEIHQRSRAVAHVD